MRLLLMPAALAACAAMPAAAQVVPVDIPPSAVDEAPVYEPDYVEPAYDERDAPDGTIPDDVIEALEDPVRQDAIADAMTGMMRAMMNVRVGPIVEAVERIDPSRERRRRVDPDATLGELAGTDDPEYMDGVEDGIRRTTRMSGTVMREMARTMPVFVGMAKDLGAQLEGATRRAVGDVAREVDRERRRN